MGKKRQVGSSGYGGSEWGHSGAKPIGKHTSTWICLAPATWDVLWRKNDALETRDALV